MKRTWMIVLAITLLAGCGKRAAVEERGDAKKAKTSEAAEPHRENYIEEANVVELAVEAQRRATPRCNSPARYSRSTAR
jgi:PBP1b-binding outer membrane lipoprotein LpoB